VRSPTTFFWLLRRPHQVARPSLRLRRRLRQVARPPSGSVVVRQVARPSSGSVIILIRSPELPPALSSSWPGRQQPPSVSVIAFVKDQDLPPASLSSASGRSTLLRLHRCLRQLGRPSQVFTLGVKASLWGARLMVLPSTSGCLGAIDLRPFLGWHASSGPAKLFAAMQDIWVSLHSICSKSTNLHGFISNDPTHRNFSYAIIDDCRMDLPGPTTSVGTRTDYSVGPWDYPTCAARYLIA
jgi:hypothetical protein